MTWTINWSDDARRQLRKLDKHIQSKVLTYINTRVLQTKHPQDLGKPLKHDKFGLWRYRVEDIRIICQIRDEESIILLLHLGHRRSVYKN